MDERKHGALGKVIERMTEQHIDPEDMLDPDDIEIRNKGGALTMPDCERCTDKCCVHKDPTSGILLSLQDVAHLVDSGHADVIVGTFTFKRNKHGKVLDEVDEMPKLAKQPDGNCHFYDEKSGRCTGYGVRPTICRRFPYEVGYRKGGTRPFARFIGWSQCPTVEGPQYQASIEQMSRDAVVDENVSYQDAVLLGDHVEELRKTGFAPFLPPPEECPGGGGSQAREDEEGKKGKKDKKGKGEERRADADEEPVEITAP